MEIETSDNISLDINKIEHSLEKRTETLKPLSGDCCIYIVPPRIREPNKQKFTPLIVSIGPFHHGKIELQPMEEHKCRYLCDFLRRINMSLREYTKGLKELEIRLRQSYVEIHGYDREDFMEIMAVDGAFVMEFLLRYHYGGWQNNDRIFGRQMLYLNIAEDLFLIENQLPFFYLNHLFQLFKESNTDEGFTLNDIVKNFISCEIFIWEWPTTTNTEDSEVHHLIHFLIVWLQQSKAIERREYESRPTPTISELHRAGVKFKPSSTHCLSSINLANGILEIPKLALTDVSEKIVRNMQVFELCHKLEYYVSDYIYMMDALINNEEDIKILTQSGVIDNWLGDNNVAASVINDLGKWNVTNVSAFSYAGVMEQLNAYYNKRRNRWRAALKQKYFSNPWTIISVIAASFLLLLTVTQTVFSILQGV